MGRKIRSYDNDAVVDGEDRLIGTNTNSNNDTANYRIEDLAAYFSDANTDRLFPNLADEYLYVNQDNSFVESFIRNEIRMTSFNNRYMANDSVNLDNAIYFTTPTVITVGSLVNNVFTNTDLRVGARIVFFNHDSTVRIISTITNINTNDRRITIEDAVDDISLIDGTTVIEGSNRIIIVTNVGIVLEGDVSIPDLRITHVVNQNPLSSQSLLSFWSGTEAEYQDLVNAGTVRADVIYFRI